MSSLLKKSAIVIAASGLVVLVGAGSSDRGLVRNTEASGKVCFHIRDIEGYSPTKVGERDGVNLRMADRNVFQLEFIAPCPDAKTASRVKIKSNSVTDYVCSGADTRLIAIQESGVQNQCVVSGMRKLDRAQITALQEDEVP